MTSLDGSFTCSRLAEKGMCKTCDNIYRDDNTAAPLSDWQQIYIICVPVPCGAD